MSKKSKIIIVRLPAALDEQSKKLREVTGIPVSEQVRRALTAYLKDHLPQ